MAAFTFASAEDRGRVLMDAGTIIVGYVCRAPSGVIGLRVLRPMSASGTTADGMNKEGAWDVLTDDAAT